MQINHKQRSEHKVSVSASASSFHLQLIRKSHFACVEKSRNLSRRASPSDRIYYDEEEDTTNVEAEKLVNTEIHGVRVD